MCVAHTHDRFVNVDALLVDAAELEAVHDVVEGALRVEVLDTGQRFAVMAGGERSDAVGQTFGDGVVTQVDVVVVAHADRHVDRPYPVTLSQHLQNHHVALVESTLALQRDDHAVGYRVGGHHHAALANGLLVDGHVDGVGGDDVQVFVLRAYPVFQHVL